MSTDVIHPARNLMDAYAQSIILPIVGNAEKEISIFKEWVKTGDTDFIPPDEWKLRAKAPGQVPDVEKPYIVKFYVPPEQQPYVLDWSRSNLERLFDIGYESGRIFVQENPDILLP
jgi:NTE family protein